MKNKTILPAIIILAAVIFGCGMIFLHTPGTQPAQYSYFHEQLEAGNIRSAVFSRNRIKFVTKEFPTVFETEDPQNPALKEQLLLQDAEIKEESGWDEKLPMFFDAVFYILFFGAGITVFRKFISPNTFRTIRRTGIKFNDIIGMDSIKKDILQVVQVMKNPEEYRKKGIRMPKGILLEGAPGNGKTLFARAVAGEANVNFIPAKATDFESMFMAIGPAKVKLLFAKARRRAPCIVFIDEFDGIGTKRNYSGSAIETENTRIVTALLNELDGFTQNSGILVLAATNSRAALDEALIRPGRFDAIYEVHFPDYAARLELIKMYTSGKPLAAECSQEDLARAFNGFSCAKIESVLNRAALLAVQADRTEITAEDVKNACQLHQS